MVASERFRWRTPYSTKLGVFVCFAPFPSVSVCNHCFSLKCTIVNCCICNGASCRNSHKCLLLTSHSCLLVPVRRVYNFVSCMDRVTPHLRLRLFMEMLCLLDHGQYALCKQLLAFTSVLESSADDQCACFHIRDSDKEILYRTTHSFGMANRSSKVAAFRNTRIPPHICALGCNTIHATRSCSLSKGPA